MKTYSNFSLIIIGLFLLGPFFTACKDDSEENSPEHHREDKIEQLAGTEGKSWILLTATSGGMELSSFLPPCEKDNLYHIKTDGTGELKGGATKCEEDEEEVLETGLWELSDDLETMTLSIGMIDNEAKILKLTDDRLQLEFIGQDEQVVVATFKPAP